MTTNTAVSGRIDLMINPDGSKRILSEQIAVPRVNRSVYMPVVREFISKNIPEKKTAYYTGYYALRNGKPSFIWGDLEENNK